MYVFISIPFFTEKGDNREYVLIILLYVMYVLYAHVCIHLPQHIPFIFSFKHTQHITYRTINTQHNKHNKHTYTIPDTRQSKLRTSYA